MGEGPGESSVLPPILVSCTTIRLKWINVYTKQVVVELSRNVHHKHITIVGEKRQAAERLWSTLCQATQWTALTESIVNNLAVTSQGSKPPEAMGVIDIADTFPWRICDQFVPCSNSGFVYLLVSTPSPERVYVGTTENLAVRINQHNRGFGSEGTGANPEFLPWAILSYMTNMASLSRSERMALETSWQVLNARSVQRGSREIEQYIENGRRVMNEYNEQHGLQLDRRINYVIMAQRRYAPELLDHTQDNQNAAPHNNMNADNNEVCCDGEKDESMDFEYCV